MGRQGGIMPKWLMVVLALIALVLGSILILFIVAKLTGYGTLGALLGQLSRQIDFIWNERISA